MMSWWRTNYYQNVKIGGLVASLDNKQVGDEGAKQICLALMDPTTKVQTLWLRNNKIGAEGARFIAFSLKRNAILNVLWLSNNNIGDLGASDMAKALKTNSTLHELSLENNCIGDDGAGHIATALNNNSTLRELSLANNHIGDAGAERLAASLWNNSTLRELSLVSNKIGDNGAVFIANAMDNNNNSNMASIYLSGNNISQLLCDLIKKSERKMYESGNTATTSNVVTMDQKYSFSAGIGVYVVTFIVLASLVVFLYFGYGEADEEVLTLDSTDVLEMKPKMLERGGWLTTRVDFIVSLIRSANFLHAREWRSSAPQGHGEAIHKESSIELANGIWVAAVVAVVVVAIFVARRKLGKRWKLGKRCVICETRTMHGVSCSEHFACSIHLKNSPCILAGESQVKCVKEGCHKLYAKSHVWWCLSREDYQQFKFHQRYNAVKRSDESPCPSLILIDPQEGLERRHKSIFKKKKAVYFVCERTRSKGHEDSMMIEFHRDWVKRISPMVKGPFTCCKSHLRYFLYPLLFSTSRRLLGKGFRNKWTKFLSNCRRFQLVPS